MKIVTYSIRYSCVKHYAFCLQIYADSSGDELTWPVTHFHHSENDNTYFVWCSRSGKPTIVCDNLAVSIVHSCDTHVQRWNAYTPRWHTVTVYIICLNNSKKMHTLTHTHIYLHIYKYIYVCVWVCASF